MRSVVFTYLAILGVLLAAGHAGYADTLYLAEPDQQVFGTLVDIGDGAVVFDAALSGQMIVPARRVRGVETERPVQVVMNNGDGCTGWLVFVDDQTQLKSDGTTRPLALTDIIGVGDAPPMFVADLMINDKKESVPLTEETAPTQNLQLDATLSDHLVLDPASNFFERPTNRTFHEFEPSLSADSAFESGWSPALHFEMESLAGDDDAYRGRLLIGSRYSGSTHSGLQWSVTFGGVGREERRAASDVWNYLASSKSLSKSVHLPSRAQSFERATEIDAAMTVDVRKKLFYGVELEEGLSLYPSVTAPGDWLGQTSAGVRIPLRRDERLSLKMDWRLAYDSEPLFEEDSHFRSTFGASVRWKF